MTEPTKYDAVDAAIMEFVRANPGPMSGAILSAVRDQAHAARSDNQCAMRVVDVRLQALKRRGALAFLKSPRGWFITPELPHG